MPGIRETEFQQYLPEFTVKQAAASFSENGEVVSAVGRSGAPDYFVVAFATREKKFGPLALNPVVAKVLLSALEKHVARLAPEQP